MIAVASSLLMAKETLQQAGQVRLFHLKIPLPPSLGNKMPLIPKVPLQRTRPFIKSQRTQTCLKMKLQTGDTESYTKK